MNEAVMKAMEFLGLYESLEIRKNAVTIVSKTLCYDHGGMDEAVVSNCLEQFTSILSEGDTQVKRVVAEYFGNVVLSLNLD